MATKHKDHSHDDEKTAPNAHSKEHAPAETAKPKPDADPLAALKATEPQNH